MFHVKSKNLRRSLTYHLDIEREKSELLKKMGNWGNQEYRKKYYCDFIAILLLLVCF